METRGKFEPAKQDDMRMFRSVPDFVYKYKETEEINGHVVYHIGDGVYMFKDKIPFGDGKYIEMLQKKYPDLQFIIYKRGKIAYEKNGRYGGMDYRNGIKQLVFVMSNKYKRHSRGSLYNTLHYETAHFSIADENMDIIKDFLYYTDGKNRIPHSYFEEEWRVSLDIYESFHYRETERADDKGEIYGINALLNGNSKSSGGIIGKLGFWYTPEQYEKIDGYVPYIVYDGRVAKYVYPGIYHFEDSLHMLKDMNKHDTDCYEEESRVYPCIQCFAHNDIWFGYLGTESWLGGSIQILQGINAKYIAFGKEGVSVLEEMGKKLPRYRFGKTVRDKEDDNLPGDQLAPEHRINVQNAKGKAGRKRYISYDGAVELVEGLGFQNLKIKFEMLFQSEKVYYDYKKYNFAYVSGDYLVLVYRGKGVEIPLQVISTLKVIKHRDLGAGIWEETAITVIDRRESMERDYLGDEAYERYTEYIRKSQDEPGW